MRYFLLLLLVALAVVLALRLGKSRQTAPLGESGAMLDKAKLAVLPAQLQQVEAALDAYRADRGACPGDLAELVPGYLPASDLLIDPWGTRLRLEKPDAGGAILACAGPDRTFASPDDTRRSLR
jgi:hypothetical protein